MLKEKIKIIAEAVVGLKHYEWARIRNTIDKKFSSASSRVELMNAEEL